MTLAVSKLEFETLLMSKELAIEISSDPNGYFVAVKTACCEKTIPYKISKEHLLAAQSSSKIEKLQFHHCTNPYKAKDKAGNAGPPPTYYCKRCKFLLEDVELPECPMCNERKPGRTITIYESSSDVIQYDINITMGDIRKLLLYAGGMRIFDEKPPAERYSYGSHANPDRTIFYPGVYDPSEVGVLFSKKNKEYVKIIRGLNPEFKPL